MERVDLTQKLLKQLPAFRAHALLKLVHDPFRRQHAIKLASLSDLPANDLRQRNSTAEIRLRTLRTRDFRLQPIGIHLRARQTELDFAKSTYERWHRAPIGVVSVQGTLTKQDDFEIAAARLHTAMAEMNVVQGEVDRLRQQLNFKRITSPLDGVLIERNLNIGMPVNDSCGTVERPDRALFRVIDLHKIRVFVKVPQDKSGGIEAGLKANLGLPQFPNKVFPAVVVSYSPAIDEKSEPLLVELHVDNPDGKLQPGSRAEVQIELVSKQ